MEQKILAALAQKNYVPLKPKALARKIGVTSGDYPQFRQALRDTKPADVTDAAIRQHLLAELAKQSWAPVTTIDVTVRDGVAHLWGTLMEERQRQGIRVVAENTPGVKRVEDHLVWIEPVSGIVVPSADDFKSIGQVS